MLNEYSAPSNELAVDNIDEPHTHLLFQIAISNRDLLHLFVERHILVDDSSCHFTSFGELFVLEEEPFNVQALLLLLDDFHSQNAFKERDKGISALLELSQRRGSPAIFEGKLLQLCLIVNLFGLI